MNAQTFDFIIQNLQDRYTEIKKQFDELMHDWDQQTDKIKLHARIERFKEYISKAVAVGNFKSFIDQLSEQDGILRNLHAANENIRKEIVQKAQALNDTGIQRFDRGVEASSNSI